MLNVEVNIDVIRSSLIIDELSIETIRIDLCSLNEPFDMKNLRRQRMSIDMMTLSYFIIERCIVVIIVFMADPYVIP
jgi:hypothetical protein